jgi:hypothetical protein
MFCFQGIWIRPTLNETPRQIHVFLTTARDGMNGQIHAPAALSRGKVTPVLPGWEAGWAPEPVCTRWRKENIPASAVNRNSVFQPEAQSLNWLSYPASSTMINIQRRIQKLPDRVDKYIYTLTKINTSWEATQKVMEAKLITLTHKIAIIQLHLVAESCTICSSVNVLRFSICFCP